MADEINTRLVRVEVKQEILDSNHKDLKLSIEFAIKDLKADFDKRFHEQKIDVDKKFDEIKKDMKDNFNDQNIKLDSIIKTLSSVDLKKIDETVQEMEHKRFVFTGGYKMIIFLVTAVGSIAVALDWILSHFIK